MSTFLMPALALMVNALIFGVSWWPFRELQGHGLHPLWATALTFVVSLTGLMLIRPGAWRGLLQYPMLWLLVIASGLTNVGFNWAVTVGDVVRVVLLFYLMPAWVLLLAWPLLRERPGVGSLFRLALALAGLVVVLKTPDWLALMGGFCFALTNVLLRRLNHTPGDARTLAMFVGGAVMSSAAALAGMQLGVVTAPPTHGGTWIGLAVLLSLALLIGNLALQYGAARLRATATSLIMLSEVVFASVSSVLWGAAELSTRTVLGGALIMLAALLSVFSSDSA